MNQKTFRFFSILFTVLLMASFLAEMMVLTDGELHFLNYLIFFAQDIVSLFGIFYLLSGCKKGEGTRHYKGYMIAFAVLAFLSMPQAQNMDVAGIMLLTLQFGALCVLCFGKDLGKNFSTFLAWLVTACSALQFVTYGISGTLDRVTVLKLATALILALITVLMVAAKYADKKARGSKV